MSCAWALVSGAVVCAVLVDEAVLDEALVGGVHERKDEIFIQSHSYSN